MIDRQAIAQIGTLLRQGKGIPEIAGTVGLEIGDVETVLAGAASSLVLGLEGEVSGDVYARVGNDGKVGGPGGSPLTDSVASGSSDQAVIYVSSANGNDGNNGLSPGNAKATIQAAISALPADSGNPKGRVKFVGTQIVSSVGRFVPVTYNATATVPDATASSADVGAYVIGPGAPNNTKIVSVVAGVSFTMDTATASTSTTWALITKPGIVLPPGVYLEGEGPSHEYDDNTQFVNNGVSTIQDNGSGITILTPADGNVTEWPRFRFGLRRMVIYGSGTNMFGLYNQDQAWYIECEDVDFFNHGLAGVALADNVNSHDFRNCNFCNNGNANATIPTNHLTGPSALLATGGVLEGYGNSQSSAALNLYNCFFFSNYGVGVGQGGPGSLGPADCANLNGCQFNLTLATPLNNSGISAYLTNGSSLLNCLSEDAALTQVRTRGAVAIINGSYADGRVTSTAGCAIQVEQGSVVVMGVAASSSVSAIGTLPGQPQVFWAGCHCQNSNPWCRDWDTGNTFPAATAPGPGWINSSASAPLVATQQATSYTFTAADAGTVVECTDASAATFTVPPNSSVAFAVGTVIEVFQDGAGAVTIAAGAGVTLRSDGAKVHTAAQYATISLRKRGTNEWVLSGDLV